MNAKIVRYTLCMGSTFWSCNGNCKFSCVHTWIKWLYI